MGATNFFAVGKGRDLREAFSEAVESARYEYGHGGYTGTIAEKNSVKLAAWHRLPPKKARRLAQTCMDNDSHFCNDKWGPAAAICTKEPKGTRGKGEWIFFGMASC